MKEQEKIIRYWHAVELLQPQSAPKIVKTSSKYGPFVEDTVSSRMILPWEPGSSLSKKKIEAERKWRHTLYAHLYDASLVDNALGELYGVDGQYSEPSYRSSALFAARFTQSGNLVEDSFVLSTEAWFVGRAKAGRDWSRGFEDDQRKAAEQAIQQLDGQVSGVALRDYTRWLIQFLGLNDFFANGHEQIFRFKSEAFKTDTPSTEETPLNSNILEDLANVADNIGKGATSEALSQYLRIHDVEQRLRLDDEASTPSVIKRLLPRLYADSCWPRCLVPRCAGLD
ncbi:hypothetical protein [Aquabacterium sp.]|uniref:hypothetical protein n=1 Tax=Aquabacterium sp. TaxID=1872578 RepID=UPI00262308A0|nr:hypothetical protein [Aquabacterium sp.]MDD2978208.1 hypothetical protein [Aquabacterium sp.]